MAAGLFVTTIINIGRGSEHIPLHKSLVGSLFCLVIAFVSFQTAIYGKGKARHQERKKCYKWRW